MPPSARHQRILTVQNTSGWQPSARWTKIFPRRPPEVVVLGRVCSSRCERTPPLRRTEPGLAGRPVRAPAPVTWNTNKPSSSSGIEDHEQRGLLGPATVLSRKPHQASVDSDDPGSRHGRPSAIILCAARPAWRGALVCNDSASRRGRGGCSLTTSPRTALPVLNSVLIALDMLLTVDFRPPRAPTTSVIG